jgi:hypothetical protein
MTFEQYIGKNCGIEPYVAFHSNAQMRITASLTRKFKLEKFNYVHLSYDGETDRVGMKFLVASEVGAMKLNKQANSMSVSVTGFIMNMGLEVDGRYYNITAEDGLIIIDLGGSS